MKFTKQAIVRAVMMFVAITNIILVALGQDTIEICEDSIYQGVSVLFLIFAAWRAFWKNNSATIGHKLGDAIAKLINNGDKSVLADVEKLLDEYKEKTEGGESDGADDN